MRGNPSCEQRSLQTYHKRMSSPVQWIRSSTAARPPTSLPVQVSQSRVVLQSRLSCLAQPCLKTSSELTWSATWQNQWFRSTCWRGSREVWRGESAGELGKGGVSRKEDYIDINSLGRMSPQMSQHCCPDTQNGQRSRSGSRHHRGLDILRERNDTWT